MNIYEDLYRFRQSEKLSPRENFLSVALTDLLNRLPDDVMQDAIARLFMPESGLAEWNQFIAEQNQPWRWQTHVRISGGVIDMALMDRENQPILIIENKISAPISRPALVELPKHRSGIAQDNQLGVYGRWLAKCRRNSRWRGALILLTHYTAAPPDFENNDNTYGAKILRHTCHWNEVWHWLSQRVHDPAAQPTVTWRSLTAELAALLEEWGMSGESLMTKNIQALDDYLKAEHAAKVRKAFDAIYAAMKPNLNALRAKTISLDGHMLAMDSSIYSQVELDKGAATEDWVIEWGIVFPGAGFHGAVTNVGIPEDVACWYLGIFGYRENLRTLPDWMASPPVDWHLIRPDDNPPHEFGWFTCRSIASFAKNEEISTVSVGHWFAAKLKQLHQYAPALRP